MASITQICENILLEIYYFHNSKRNKRFHFSWKLGYLRKYLYLCVYIFSHRQYHEFRQWIVYALWTSASFAKLVLWVFAVRGFSKCKLRSHHVYPCNPLVAPVICFVGTYGVWRAHTLRDAIFSVRHTQREEYQYVVVHERDTPALPPSSVNKHDV